MVPATISHWTIDKNLSFDGWTKHSHKPSPIVPGFVAPTKQSQLKFSAIALAGAIARTSTLIGASDTMLRALAAIAIMDVELKIQDGATFALSPNFDFLADAEKTAFAGRIGAGITDLAMNSLGYVWRDNAACLASSLDPHADFIYGGGLVEGHGVVLSKHMGALLEA